MADRPGLRRAVQAIERGADVEGAGAQRVLRAALHVGREVRNALAHLGRRSPIGPFGLAGDLVRTRPGEAVTADADAVLQRLALREHQIEPAFGGLDDNRAHLELGFVRNDLALDLLVAAATG